MDMLIRNLERGTARDLKKYLYHWYLSEKGTHEEKIKGLFVSLEKIVLPPMTDKLKTAIVAYIERRNMLFEAKIINKLET